MKINKLFAATLAATAILASCSNEDNGGGGNNGDTQNITISLKQPTARAVTGSEYGKTAPVVFADGELFLVDAAEAIVDVYTFKSSGTTDLANKEILISDATATNGVTITGVPGSVKTAYIVGNSSSIKALNSSYATYAMSSKPISNIKTLPITPAMQFNAARDLENATLWGEGTLVQDPTAPADKTKKYVKVDLRPHVARLELADITAVPSTDATPVTVTEYKVTGIYTNYYLPTITMDWTTPGTVVANGQAGTAVYNSVTNGGIYPDALAGIIYDESATFFDNTTHTAATKYPNGTDNTDVWAYNLLAAPKFGVSGDPFFSATTGAPHIIIQVKDVKGSNGADYSSFRYITVGKLFQMDGTTEITHFEAGNIYRIAAGDLTFTIKNVYVEGETEKIDLRCEVEVINWTSVGMKPGLN